MIVVHRDCKEKGHQIRTGDDTTGREGEDDGMRNLRCVRDWISEQTLSSMSDVNRQRHPGTPEMLMKEERGEQRSKWRFKSVREGEPLIKPDIMM